MPFYYDLNRALTTSGSAGTEVTHFFGQSVANQETVGISGFYAASRFGTAGGAQFRIKDNGSSAATGGGSQTPRPRNLRGSAAAQSTWKNDGSVITAGGSLTTRVTVGFAQTGGMGGWVATEPVNKIQMMPNAVNPIDIEFTSLANAASVTFDGTIEFGEGI